MRLQPIKLLDITAFCLFINQFILPANAAESKYKSHSPDGRKIHNPVPEEYRQIEFLGALSFASVCILLGTGRSMKLAKKTVKKSLNRKNIPKAR